MMPAMAMASRKERATLIVYASHQQRPTPLSFAKGQFGMYWHLPFDVKLINLRCLTSHPLGVEAGVDRLLAGAPEMGAVFAVIREPLQGQGQLARIVRLDQQSAARCLDQFGKRAVA